MRARDALISATLAGIVSAGTSLVALLNQVHAFEEIRGPALLVVAIGAIVNVAKDLQTRYSPIRRHGGAEE